MRGTLVFIALFLSLTACAATAFAASPVSYQKLYIRGAYVHLVTVDMNDPHVCVSPALSNRGIGSAEGFGSMLSRLKPAAAITGTYFSIRTRVPVGDIVIGGREVNTGFVGTTVCITSDNRVEVKPLKGARNANWTLYPYAISSGPRLVTNGSVGVYPISEGFRDGAIRRKARRAALGITRKNKLLLVAVTRPVYLRTLAQIMHDLGAYDAINLDGGSSTALHYNGKVIVHPNRRLTNLIVVYDSHSAFGDAKSALAPMVTSAKPSAKHHI